MLIPQLKLAGQAPIAKGKTRLIYQHPERSDWLVKVHRSRLSGNESGWSRRWRQAEDRFLFRAGILRELQPYLDSRYDKANHPMIPHLVPIIGIADTDQGLGLVVQAARGPDGKLAPTLRKLRRQGAMTAAQIRSVYELLDKIIATPLVLGDLNQDNVVLVPDVATGGQRAMLIDGLGDRTWVPVCYWSAWVNRRSKQRFVNKMRRKLKAMENQ